MKSGFVAILGQPNVGKSTLLNAILKEKVSIVSPKPQTTRNKILGILNDDDGQIVFIDTPGIHNSHNKLDEYMNKAIINAKEDVDVILYVVDGRKKITDQTIELLNKYTKNTENIILVVNKIDETTYEKLYPELAKCNGLENIKDIVPISALKGKNLEELIKVIKSYMKDDVRYFDEDIYTDQSIKFLVSEIIREKALWLLQDELPHGIAVDITRFSEGELCEIDVDLIVERPNHKQIVIGKNGLKLKEIGTKSRLDIEKLVDRKVMLRIFVKVKEDWRNSSGTVKALGYNQQDL